MKIFGKKENKIENDIQNTFNEDSIELLVEDGEIENIEEIEGDNK